MNDIDRLLVLIILGGIFYLLYKYQDAIFGQIDHSPAPLPHTTNTKIPTTGQIPQSGNTGQKPNVAHQKEKQTDTRHCSKISADNISRVSLESLDEVNQKKYKHAALLDTADDNTISLGSLRSSGSFGSSFFSDI